MNKATLARALAPRKPLPPKANASARAAHIKELATAKAYGTKGTLAVIGRHPTYLFDAVDFGASYFHIEESTWNQLDNNEQWEANVHFLDFCAEKGDVFLISSGDRVNNSPSILEKEVNYLIEKKGYHYNGDRTKLVR